MIKKTLSILYFVIFVLTVNAQRMNLPTEYIRQKIIDRNIPSNVQGVRYNNNEFIVSTIHIKDAEPFSIPLRYDPLNDEMQMRKGNQIIYLNKIDSLKINLSNKVYEIHYYLEVGNSDKGYFVNLTPNENVKLLLQERKKFVEGKKAQDSYKKDIPPSFKDYKTYYLKKDNSIIEVNLSKKKFLKLLSDEEKEIKIYLSKNKLKKNTDFIELVKFYNKLKNK